MKKSLSIPSNLKNLISGFVVFILCTSGVFAQNYPHTYFVPFTDKENTPYSINNPDEFLSNRAITRRENRNIPVTEQDLPVDPNYIFSIRNVPGVTFLYPLKWFNGAVFSVQDTSVLTEIRNFTFVKSDEIVHTSPDLDLSGKKAKVEKVRGKSPKVNENNDLGEAQAQIEQIGLDSLHLLKYTGRGILIGVLDAGYSEAKEIEAIAHLFDNDRIKGERDFVSHSGSQLYSASTHGTAVLTTMAASKPGEIMGTAPDAEYLLIRTENGAAEFEFLVEEYNWAAGAEFADSAGADILNTSLGYTEFEDENQNHTYEDLDGNTTPITRASNIAFSKGMLVINSAGNLGNSSWKYISAPADGKDVLAVGGVNNNGSHVGFSGIGPNSAGQVKPDVAALGRSVASAHTSPADIRLVSGTSFSAPLLSGAAACLWQAYRQLSHEEIKQLIIESAHLYPESNDNLGYGIPNFRAAYDKLEEAEVDSIITRRKNQTLVYPNPASESITVITNGSGDYTIHDVKGNKLSSGIIERKKIINIQSYMPGVYILKYNGEQIKFVKEKY